MTNDNNDNEFIPITESQINRNIIGCGYKSKYEELKNSMINGNEASQELRTSMSLEGFSKFVKQNKLIAKNEKMNANIIEQDNINNNNNEIDNSNFENMYCNVNNGQSGLYTTWNSQKFPNEEQQNDVNDINENSPLNIKEDINYLEKNKNKNICIGGTFCDNIKIEQKEYNGFTKNFINDENNSYFEIETELKKENIKGQSLQIIGNDTLMRTYPIFHVEKINKGLKIYTRYNSRGFRVYENVYYRIQNIKTDEEIIKEENK